MKSLRHSSTTRALLLGVLPFIPACALIVNGTKQRVAVNTTPPGARVTINKHYHGCCTPLVANLSRRMDHLIEIELDGYQPYSLIIQSDGVNGWFWGNLISWGIIGFGIDLISGAAYKLTPEQVQAQMAKSDMGAEFGEDEGLVFVTVVMEPEPEWEKIGQLQRIEE